MNPGFSAPPDGQMVAILLVDGRCMIEEKLCAALSAELAGIALIGGPAALAYAELCGVSDLNAGSAGFSSHPAVVRIGDRVYPRGIMGTHKGGALGFACAIDRGIVFSIAVPGDVLQ